MNETLLANLFFIVTGTAILVVGAFMCFVLYHVFKVVKVVRSILERVHASADLLVEDVQMLHRQLQEGSIVGRILTALLGTARKRRTRTASRKKGTVTNEDNA